MGVRPRTAVVLLALVTVAGAVFAAPAQAPGPPDPARLEQDARRIETMLIAPCCFSQQVSEHQSPAADEVRRDVRARLAAGQSRQQILDAYVEQHGVRILAEPPARGFNRTLYLTPVVLFVATLGALALVLRRFSARVPTESAPAAADSAVAAPGAGPGPARPSDVPSPALAERLDDELRDLD